MWEDNNPLAYDDESPTFDHFPSTFHNPHLIHDDHDNSDDDEHHQAHLDHSPPASPDSHKPPPTFLTRTPSERSRDDEPSLGRSRPLNQEEQEDEEYRRMRREQGYSGRVEQMLLERDNIEIEITDAGKNHEGTGGFIVYTIKTGVCRVQSLRFKFEVGWGGD